MTTDQTAEVPSDDRAVRVSAVLIPSMLALGAAIAKWVPPGGTFDGIATSAVLVVEFVCAGFMSAAIARKSRKQGGHLPGVVVFVVVFVCLSLILLYAGLYLNCTFGRGPCEL